MKTNHSQFSILNSQFIHAALIFALGGTFSCSKGDKQPVEKQAVVIDTVIQSTGNVKLDSLLRLAATAKQDTNLARLYAEIGDIYFGIDARKSKDYYLKTSALTEKLNWNEGRYLFVKGFTNVLITEGLLDSSLVLNRQILELAKKEKNEIQIAKILMSIGNTYNTKTDYKNAIQYYMEALPAIEKSNNKPLISQLYGVMGVVYKYIGMKDEALMYGKKSVDIWNEQPDDIRRAYALINYGSTLIKYNQLEKAENILLETQRICLLHNNKRALNSVHSYLGFIALKKFDLDKSEMYDKKVLEYDLKFDDIHAISGSYRTLANIEFLKGNFDKSERYVYEALKYAEKEDIMQEKWQLNSFLSSLSIARHDFRKYSYYDAIADSIKSIMDTETTMKNAKDFEVKYETEKKELEIQNQKNIIKKQNLQRGLLAGSVAVSVVILAMLWYMLRLRNRRNHALTERNDALAEMNATKDKFFSIISHDLKNPAIAQRDALQLLIKNAGLWNVDALTDYYQELLNSADGQVELLYNLLNWAQLQTGRMAYTPTTFTLSDLLSDTTLIRNMAKSKGITLILPQSQDALITGDRNMLSTVIRNLLTNAVKFTPAGGTVTLTAFQAPSNSLERGENSPPVEGLGEVHISVTDTGVGMSEEQIRNLFQLDSRQSRRGTADEQGSGLGLIVCKELLEKHGSELHVESEEGKGSRFCFTISAASFC